MSESRSHFHSTKKYPEFWTERALHLADYGERIDVFKELLPKDVKSILEVGCGSGYNLVAIYYVGKYKLLGIDNLEYAVNEANKRFGRLVKVILADGLDIPSPNNTYDLVLACGYLDWLSYDDLPKAISELIRVSRKYILVIDYCFVGDMSPYHKETELYVAVRGKPLYAVRNYPLFFENLTLIKHIEILPTEFSNIPMSAWLFEGRD